MTDEFTLTPPDETPVTVGSRTETERRLQLTRQARMRRQFGPGPAGQTCKGCVHLVRLRPGSRSFLKCDVYGVTRSEASDWRAKWPACGRFEATS